MAAEAPAASPWRRAAGWLLRLPANVLIGVVRGYRLLLKPWLGNACRFEPSCSAYTLLALQRHGASGGVLLGGWRLLRCQPWCDGGCDPVPDHHPLRGLFTRFTAAGPADDERQAVAEDPHQGPANPSPARPSSSSRTSSP